MRTRLRCLLALLTVAATASCTRESGQSSPTPPPTATIGPSATAPTPARSAPTGRATAPRTSASRTAPTKRPTPSATAPKPTRTRTRTARPSPTATAAKSPTAEPPGPSPAFTARVSRIDAAMRARMTKSWRPGCPVSLDRLRLVTASHWGYDGRVRTGELVVHRDAADAIVTVLRRLYEARFPIQRMRLVDEYGADDRTSMRANNTSAFNCRPVEGRPGVWSQHAYGRAIDINPLVNPYVDGAEIDPPEGARYADRSVRAPGLIRSGDVVVRAFASVGWAWGGYWRNSKDYQHFSATGR